MYDRKSLNPTLGNAVPAPGEVGEIGQQVQRLEATISSLYCALDALSERLSPILHSPSPVGEAGLAVGPRDTEMGQFILTCNDRLDSLIARVVDIRTRVAL